MAHVRNILRIAHLAVGIWIAIFVFSPLRLDDTAALYAQISIVSLGLSGLVLWQLPRIARSVRRT